MNVWPTCTMCMRGASRSQKKISDPQNFSYSWLWTTMCVLGTDPSPLQEQQAFLNSKPPLQPHN